MGRLTKERAKKILGNAPEGHLFWCCEGSVFKNLKELNNGLKAMGDESYAHHVRKENNDFSNWIKDIVEDERLSKQLFRVKDKKKAALLVRERLKLLRNFVKLKTTKIVVPKKKVVKKKAVKKI